MSEHWGERWNEALEAGWRALASTPSVRAAATGDDAQWVISPAVDNILSGVSRTQSTADDIEGTIDRVLDLFGSTSAAGGLWLLRPDDQPDDLASRLARRGMLIGGSGMGARAGDLRPPPHPTDVTLARATGDEDIEDWRAVAHAAWTNDVDSADSMADLFRAVLKADGDALQLWVGRVRGKPAAMSTAFVGGGTINVEYVGVVPEHRGRGIGAAVTWAPIAACGDFELAVIGESEESASLYRRLGFAAFGNTGRFALIPGAHPGPTT